MRENVRFRTGRARSKVKTTRFRIVLDRNTYKTREKHVKTRGFGKAGRGAK